MAHALRSKGRSTRGSMLQLNPGADPSCVISESQRAHACRLQARGRPGCRARRARGDAGGRPGRAQACKAKPKPNPKLCLQGSSARATWTRRAPCAWRCRRPAWARAGPRRRRPPTRRPPSWTRTRAGTASRRAQGATSQGRTHMSCSPFRTHVYATFHGPWVSYLPAWQACRRRRRRIGLTGLLRACVSDRIICGKELGSRRGYFARAVLAVLPAFCRKHSMRGHDQLARVTRNIVLGVATQSAGAV